MNFKQIALIIGATLLLLASLPLIGVGSVALTGVSMVEGSANNLVSDSMSEAMKESEDNYNKVKDTGMAMGEGVGATLLVFGILALGGGITCAVFASKQKSSA